MDESFKITLLTVVTVYLVMAAGAVCGRIGWLEKTARKNLLTIVVNLLFPCLIIKNVLGNPVFDDPRNLYGPPMLGFGIIFFSVLLAFGVATILPDRWTTLDSRQKVGTFAACLGMLNYGYVPIPLITDLFPNDSGTLGVLFVQNVGTELALWTVCVSVFLGRLDWKTARSLVNIPVCVILICLMINVVGVRNHLPESFWAFVDRSGLDILFWKPIETLASAAIPLSLVCVGGAIADQFHLRDFTTDLGKTVKLSILSIFLRLVVLPLLILLLAKFLPASREMKIVLIIYAAMSSASFPIVLSEIYGGDVKTALLTSISNSIVAVVTTPIWILVGMKWVF